MMAYSKNGVLKFRDESVALPKSLRGVGDSWTLTCDASSSSEEENEEDANFYIDKTDRFSDGRFKETTTAAKRSRSLCITPAEHNSIVVAENHISQPWSSLFKYDSFNAVQSACFNVAACSDENLIVSAPTGCGKTVLFELAILRMMAESKHQNAKVVLLCPIRALCQERVQDWSSRFREFGVKVLELSGDMNQHDIKEVSTAQVICTTPEKWDSITRRWTEHIYLLGKVQLLLVDEVHNIGDSRGATMEAVICRMKSVSKSAAVVKYGLPSADLRIVALSATLPNLECIGEFIEAKEENILNFGPEFRPVPLTVHVCGYAAQSSDFWFEKNLEKKVVEVIQKYGVGRPALIFCGSRKSTETTCNLIVKVSPLSRDLTLIKASKQAHDQKLGESLACGVAFHHANLQLQDRVLVENLYRERKILALCCTSSLAMGVNLPAHLVVIKSTAQWQGKGSGYCQMANSAILQMIGRAGRPGLDDHGVAVIMTNDSHKAHYQKISTGCETIESRLHEDLVETLNTEIGNNVVQSVEDAANWIKSTFLYTRLKKNPALYGLHLPQSQQTTDQSSGSFMDSKVLTFLHDKIKVALHELTSTNIVQFDNDGILIIPMKPSHIMSRQMLSIETMKVVLNIQSDFNVEEVLFSLSTAKEVTFELRHGQKKQLKELNCSVRFPVPKSKKLEVVDKTFLQFQAALGRLSVDDQTLSREQSAMTEQAGRILTAVIDHGLDSNFGATVLSAAVLRRNLSVMSWESGVSEVYQLDIPEIMVKKLESFGFSTIRGIAEGSPLAVESCVGRRSPFGMKLVQLSQRLLSQALCLTVPDPIAVDRKVVKTVKPIEVKIVKKYTYTTSLSRNVLPGSAEHISYTLIAFTKKPNTNQLFGKTKTFHGVHLFRKVTEECTVQFPLEASKAIAESTLYICLLASKVGFDDHMLLTVNGPSNCDPSVMLYGSNTSSRATSSKNTQGATTPIVHSATTRASTTGSSPAAGSSERKQMTNNDPVKAINSRINTTEDDMSDDIVMGTVRSSKSSSLGNSQQLVAQSINFDNETGNSQRTNKKRKVDSTNNATKDTKLKASLSTLNNELDFENKKTHLDLTQDYSMMQKQPSKKKDNNRHQPRSSEGGFKQRSQSVSDIQHTNKNITGNVLEVPISSGLSRKSTVGTRSIRDHMGIGGTLGALRQKAEEMDLLHNVRSSRLSSSSQAANSDILWNEPSSNNSRKGNNPYTRRSERSDGSVEKGNDLRNDFFQSSATQTYTGFANNSRRSDEHLQQQQQQQQQCQQLLIDSTTSISSGRSAIMMQSDTTTDNAASREQHWTQDSSTHGGVFSPSSKVLPFFHFKEAATFREKNEETNSAARKPNDGNRNRFTIDHKGEEVRQGTMLGVRASSLSPSFLTKGSTKSMPASVITITKSSMDTEDLFHDKNKQGQQQHGERLNQSSRNRISPIPSKYHESPAYSSGLLPHRNNQQVADVALVSRKPSHNSRPKQATQPPRRQLLLGDPPSKIDFDVFF